MSIIEKAANRLGIQKAASTESDGPTSSTPVQPTAAAPAPVTQNLAPAAAPAPVETPTAVHPSGTDKPNAPQAKGQPSNTTQGNVVRNSEVKRSRQVDINLARLHEMGMITPQGGRTGLAEEFRIIKRPLLKTVFEQRHGSGNPNNLIMITSALPGEGKTFCAINLAMSIAMELDHTVMLIDADVARPSVLRTLGVQSELGLMDMLIDEKLELTDVMLKTNVDTLSIVPSGRKHVHATELLASQTMSHFLSDVAHRYSDRVVIFDSPPLLLTSEARVLAGQMGQIVVIVEAETTTQHAVGEALQQLENCPNVSLVYNKSRDLVGGDQYGYHYG